MAKTSNWRPFNDSNPARSVECKGFNGRVVNLALCANGIPVSLRGREVCPELAQDAIAEQFAATEESQRLREARKQLDQCRSDRKAVEASLQELRSDLTREGAAADLMSLRSQQTILAAIEADLITAAAQAWDAAQRRLYAIEEEARQAIFIEATRQKNEALSEICPAIAEVLERLTAADARLARSVRTTSTIGHYGSGPNRGTYTTSAYDHLLGNRIPDDQPANDAAREAVAVV